MIVCVSLNPALDRRIVLKTLELGAVNRALSAAATPGGKSANVAVAARALGSSVRYLGLLGGPTGRAVAQALSSHGVEVESVETAAETRINLELVDSRGVTEVLEPGSAPTPQELVELVARCHKVFQASAPNAVVAFSGSLPPGMANDVYARLIELARAQGLRSILDSSGASLEQALGAQADFVKPNREEAEALLQRRIVTPYDAKEAAQQLLRRGPRAAIVSLGSAGLVGTDGEGALLIEPPVVDSLSTVGCGDATVAGLAVALERSYERAEQLAFAAACGAANCLAKVKGCLDPSTVEELRRSTRTTRLD